MPSGADFSAGGNPFGGSFPGGSTFSFSSGGPGGGGRGGFTPSDPAFIFE